MESKIELGNMIRRARTREGLTQTGLGEKVGVSQGTIVQWEKGRVPNPEQMLNLERVLGSLMKNKPKGDHVLRSDVSSFGLWLTSERIAANLSVPELAKKADVSPPAVYNIESGKTQNPQSEIKKRLSKALKKAVPDEVIEDTKEDQTIEGIGELIDFQPHTKPDWPKCAGVYVLYDTVQRPVYVGKARKISDRLREHEQKFWFKSPIVEFASYIEVIDETLRNQLEQTLIRFLKSNAVINKQSRDGFMDE